MVTYFYNTTNKKKTCKKYEQYTFVMFFFGKNIKTFLNLNNRDYSS